MPDPFSEIFEREGRRAGLSIAEQKRSASR
jgi:hypothetical protein